MEELISRIVSNVGLSDDLAKSAVGIIMDFLRSEGPSDKIDELMVAVPGASELADAAAESSGGGLLGGMMGGGAMGAFTRLTGAGLDMGQVQGVTREVVEFAKEQAGADAIDEIVSGIPGLNQFV